jgi:hypothetical protein
MTRRQMEETGKFFQKKLNDVMMVLKEAEKMVSDLLDHDAALPNFIVIILLGTRPILGFDSHFILW